MTVEAFFAINENLGVPPLDAVIWRYMPPWVFRDLLEQRALWFSSLDILQDVFEGQVPKANFLPPWEVVVGALGPYLAHAKGIRERASKAYLDAVDHERPLNMVNCWHIAAEQSDFMWASYAAEKGSVAVRSSVGQVAKAIHVDGAQHLVFAWPITYIDHDKQAVTMEHLLAPFFVKGRLYKDEQEVRFLLHLPKPVDKGSHVSVRTEELFDSVYVRTNGDQAALIEVREQLKEAGVDRPVEVGTGVGQMR